MSRPDQRAPILRAWYRTTALSANPRRHFAVARDATLDEFVRLAATHGVFRCEARGRVAEG